MSSSRNAAKRLIKELDTWRAESADEKGIERLGPINESDLLTWEAVINGVGVGGGYDGALAALPPLSCPSVYKNLNTTRNTTEKKKEKKRNKEKKRYNLSF